MIQEGENTPVSKGTEHGDKEAFPRHEIVIEKDYTETESERSVWLDQVFGTGFSARLNGSASRIDVSAFATVLDEWKAELPSKHHGIIADLRGNLDVDTGSGKALPQVITESLRDGDWNKINAIQQLSMSVLRQYGSRDGRQGWDNLPERSKRYVRVAEMSVLMIDAIKVSQDYKDGRVSADRARRIIEKLKRFGQSGDIPASFRRGLIEPFTRSQPGEGDSVPKSQTARRSPGGHPPQPAGQSRAYSEPANTAPVAPDDFIETEFNPATGMYESADETAPTLPNEPERLRHEPPTINPEPITTPPPGLDSPPPAPPSSPAAPTP